MSQKAVPCRDGRHTLAEFLRSRAGGGDAVARWCRFCGAVVVDLDCDGRTRPGGVSGMQFPVVARENMACPE